MNENPQSGDEKKSPNARQYIAALREKRGYTIAEISGILGHSFSTVADWSCGKHNPRPESFAELVRVFDALDCPPSKSALKRLHGLSFDTAKKRWKLTLVIQTGAKVLGKRVVIHFPFCPLETAVHKRDGALAVAKAFKLKVCERIQKRGNLGKLADF